jgi:hypothetical protein
MIATLSLRYLGSVSVSFINLPLFCCGEEDCLNIFGWSRCGELVTAFENALDS